MGKMAFLLPNQQFQITEALNPNQPVMALSFLIEFVREKALLHFCLLINTSTIGDVIS